MFREKFEEAFRKFKSMHLLGVRGASPPPPEACEFIKNLVEKAMETYNFLKL